MFLKATLHCKLLFIFTEYIHPAPEVSAFLDQDRGQCDFIAQRQPGLSEFYSSFNQFAAWWRHTKGVGHSKYMTDLILIKPNDQQMTFWTGKFAFNLSSLV